MNKILTLVNFSINKS